MTIQEIYEFIAFNEDINCPGIENTDHLENIAEWIYSNFISKKVDGKFRDKKVMTLGETNNVLLNDLFDTFNECLNIAIKKNNDYGGSNENPFNNFTNSLTVGVSIEKGILVRMMDKVSRISTLLEKEGKVKDESIQDTLNDLINYTAILKSYIGQSKNVNLNNRGFKVTDNTKEKKSVQEVNDNLPDWAKDKQ